MRVKERSVSTKNDVLLIHYIKYYTLQKRLYL